MKTAGSPYTRNDRMRDIIDDNSILLTVINRFSISLGFGDRTVAEICNENNVDIDTFLAVINLVGGREIPGCDVSPLPLIGYLRKSHSFILNFTLPAIKKTLIEGIQQTTTYEVAMVIMKFYDSYMEEVRQHMEYEDSVIFPYVENLLEGKINNKFRISDFSSRHEHMAGSLDELKELFIYQYNQKDNELISIALLHIIMCGNDLMSHCEIENKLLFPAASRLEDSLRDRICPENDNANQEEQETSTDDDLTAREKEVLTYVAKGLSNKQIADQMNLSFYTITTYRKNISAKLNIHSTAGLVIYAILHSLIEINDAILQ